MHIFTIYDHISEKSGNIFTTATIGEAERQFHDALANAQDGSLFKSHPQDFSLIHLGNYDDCALSITANNEPQTITKGKKPLTTEAPPT